jgi:hypothetical protein
MSPTTASPSAPKARRVRIYTRLTHPLRKRLLSYCAAAGRSERAVIEDAVERYLADPGKEASAEGPIDRLAHAIDDAERLRERQHRDLELLSQMFGRFLRLWTIVHAPTFKPATPEAAEMLSQHRATGEAFYKRLAATVADEFLRGHRFVHDLPNVDDTARAGKP